MRSLHLGITPNLTNDTKLHTGIVLQITTAVSYSCTETPWGPVRRREALWGPVRRCELPEELQHTFPQILHISGRVLEEWTPLHRMMFLGVLKIVTENTNTLVQTTTQNLPFHSLSVSLHPLWIWKEREHFHEDEEMEMFQHRMKISQNSFIVIWHFPLKEKKKDSAWHNLSFK